ncbi:hypothetical protein FNH09_20305 [Streptomyces adustus]|uniref:Protein kinase domain-containing protein n=1 Tax=Streptomyces adustus TaxID=1609272 RepID=A0A5N8VHE1_9ACTN|nr:hypothetical protein [Streptomyces adustus]MPY33504.1 hypothetical protein [Streptomyces adustus]
MANSQGSQEQTEQQNVPAPVGPAPLEAADPVSIGGFELLGRIGAGRQAVVYLGRNTHSESAAVKVLRAERRDGTRPEIRRIGTRHNCQPSVKDCQTATRTGPRTWGRSTCHPNLQQTPRMSEFNGT